MTEARGETAEAAGVTDPRDLPAAFMAAFNRGDAAAMAALYREDAIRVVGPGRVLRGDERAEPTLAFHRQGYRLTLTLEECFVTGDVALLFVSHRADNIHDETRVKHGTAVDVARRDETGHWSYLIDNPDAVGL